MCQPPLDPPSAFFLGNKVYLCLKRKGLNEVFSVMAYFHQRRRIPVRRVSLIVTLYYAELLPLVWRWRQISVPILLYFNKETGNCLRTSAKTCIVQESVWGSVSISVSVGGNKPLHGDYLLLLRLVEKKKNIICLEF